MGRIQSFLLGAFGYGLIELIWRGNTHIAMAVCGGAGFCALRLINRHTRGLPPLVSAVGAAIIISAIELIGGVICNLLLGLDIWDYSEIPFNLLGQVCATYFCLWILLCGVILDIMKRVPVRAASCISCSHSNVSS